MQIDIPGYKIVSTLGQGGMATVYLAIQSCFEREVALKVMSPHLSTDASFGERFLREARIVSRLMHPNIVTVYDVGIHEGLYYLSMEYLQGHDLKHKRFELNLAQSLSVVKDIARALDYAGRKGYVHRDVKPENIMLLDDDGRAVLMDFGIARPSDVASGMTQTGTAIGTPHYMSPEQAKGLTVDSRADLYSLGVVLFVLLAGRVPYDADSAVVVGIKHVSEAIPQLPDHLQVFQPIIDKVMAKDPDERYQTGSELSADLDTISAAQILAAMRVEDAVLDIGFGDELSPTMVNPPPMLTGEQIVNHPDTAVGNLPSAAEELDEPVVFVRDPELAAGASEAFSISEEERAEHRHYHANERTAKPGSWVGFTLLLLVIGGLVYFHADLRQYWQDHARPFLGLDAAPVTPIGQPVKPATSQSAASSSESLSRSVPTSSTYTEDEGLAPATDSDVTTTPGPQTPEQANSPEQIASIDQANNEVEAKELREQLASDPTVADDLAAIYRAAIASADTSQQAWAREGLAELQHYYAGSILGELEVGNLKAANMYAETANTLFEDPERNPALVDALARLSEHGSLNNRLDQAQEFIRDGALDAPAGANALEVYREVLAQAPDNPQAKAGLAVVAQGFGQQAHALAEDGAIQTALDLVEKGLALAPTNDELLQQQAALREQQKELQQREQALLDKAESQHVSGRVIEPSGDNAYDTYREILDVNPDSRAAREGMARIEQTLINNIQGLIERYRLLDAESAIARARERFPRSQTLLAQKVRAEQLLEEHQPRIVRVAVSNREITDIQEPQAETISADRVIYIGFEYRNFKDGTSVLQAILYDGARSLQMAQVPVIVSGSSGIQFFRIEQPVSGFSDGGYSLDLMLDNEPLMTASFNVKK